MDLRDRKRKHFRHLRNGAHHSEYLQRAYNIEPDKSVFEFQSFIFCKESELLQFEQKCIDIINPQYNMTKTAGRVDMTDEIKDKIRISNTGKKRTAETKRILSQRASEKTGDKNPFYGKNHTQETIEIMSKKAKDRILINGHPNKGKIFSQETRLKISNAASKRTGSKNPKAKAIVEISTGRVFKYIKEAAEYYSVSRQHISSVCKGKRKHTGGYKFAYLNSPAGQEAAAKFKGK